MTSGIRSRSPELSGLQYIATPKRRKLTSDSAVLITDAVHPSLVTGLRSLGYGVCYAPEITPEQTKKFIGEFNGIVINTRTAMDSTMLDQGEKLEFIARLGSGLDIIDRNYARIKGVKVYRSAEANSNAVAEHVMGMLLCLLRNIHRAREEMGDLLFRREANRGIEIEGKTVGIIGFGNNGTAFAEKFAGWKTKVLAYDKYRTHYAGHLRFVEETTVERLIEESDIVSLHIPYTEETHHMVNERFLSGMKNKSILINSSRGKIVDTRALLKALDSSQISGACLDVFEKENPENFSPEEREMYRNLWNRPNIIVTPHIAGWTFESKRKIADNLLEKIRLGVGE